MSFFVVLVDTSEGVVEFCLKVGESVTDLTVSISDSASLKDEISSPPVSSEDSSPEASDSDPSECLLLCCLTGELNSCFVGEDASCGCWDALLFKKCLWRSWADCAAAAKLAVVCPGRRPVSGIKGGGAGNPGPDMKG